MQSEPEIPPAEPEAQAEERVARILERYRGERPLDDEAAPRLEAEVRGALDQLTRAAPAEEPPPAPRPRRTAAEGDAGLQRWRRLVLAAVAAALIAAFWLRLGWIG